LSLGATDIQGGADGPPSVSTAAFIAHAKEYGLLYAIAYFVASDLGLLVKVSETVGGVC
jgi:hypothetical protein